MKEIYTGEIFVLHSMNNKPRLMRIKPKLLNPEELDLIDIDKE